MRYIFSSQHHVSLVELNIDMCLFIQYVICATRWRQSYHLPVVDY